jgi:hypothetical protein
LAGIHGQFTVTAAKQNCGLFEFLYVSVDEAEEKKHSKER